MHAPPDVRIAPNDSGLAHGAARAGIDALHDRSAALYARLHGKGVKDASRALRRHYGDLLLVEQIDRAAGSRARALWIALDADQAGEGLTPLRIAIRYARGHGGLTVSEFPLRVTRHTIARLMQRSLNHADVAAAGPVLLHHLGEAAALIEGDTLRRGDRVRTASRTGAVLWKARAIDGKLILQGQTWLDASNADPGIGAACAEWRTDVQSGRAKSAGARADPGA